MITGYALKSGWHGCTIIPTCVTIQIDAIDFGISTTSLQVNSRVLNDIA
jgi:hypothetical protein